MKRRLLCLLALLPLLCVLIGLIQTATPTLALHSIPTTTTTTKKKIPTTSRKTGEFNTAFFLGTKDRGDCKALRGKILLQFFLVSDGDCVWTEEQIANFKIQNETATAAMLSDAAGYGVTDLEVIHAYTPCRIDTLMERDDYARGIKDALAALGYADRDAISPSLADAYGTDSAALFFCFAREERCFCMPSARENGFEYVVLYGYRDFRHELYHIYGARDLYTPDRLNLIAQRYYYDSIMRITSFPVVDPLTAYLIGWTDSLDDTARAFLAECDKY